MLDTHKEKATRVSFAGDYVQSVKDNLGIDLKRLRLESSMNDVATSADGILILLSDLYAEAIDKVKSVATQEELGVSDQFDREFVESEAMQSSRRSGIKEKTLCPLLGQDVRPVGMKSLMERNVLDVRVEKYRVSRENATLRSCITQLANDYKNVTHLDLDDVPATRPRWQEYVRTNSNNLNLHD